MNKKSDFDPAELDDEDDSEIDFNDKFSKSKKAIDARRELERRLELKRLREMLDNDSLDDFD